VLLLLAASLYLALTQRSLLAGWILVALVSLILMVPTGAALIAPRRAILHRLAFEATEGPLPRSWSSRPATPSS
jgi:hypothetical protein